MKLGIKRFFIQSQKGENLFIKDEDGFLEKEEKCLKEIENFLEQTKSTLVSIETIYTPQGSIFGYKIFYTFTPNSYQEQDLLILN